MVAFLYRMPGGIRGDISRRQSTTVESLLLNPSLPFSVYGVFGKVVSGKFVPLVANDTAASIYGLFARPYPITGANASDPLGTDVPAINGIADVVRRGYMTVVLNAGTAVIDGQVYVRVANPSSGKPIGGIEALSEIAAVGAATGGNTGNGTIGTVSSVRTTAGVYTITMLTATTFRVVNPSGVRLADGVTGSAYSNGEVTFTVTVGGTPMVAGDSFTVTITPGTIPVNATFTTVADVSGNVEIAYNI